MKNIPQEQLLRQLKTMESLLTPKDRERLKKIFEPTVVTVPPMDTRSSMCVMPDGEIRIYGLYDKQSLSDTSHVLYRSSYNCGLDWKTVIPDGKVACSGARMSNGKYISFISNHICETGYTLPDTHVAHALVASSPDDTAPRVIQVADRDFSDYYLPFELVSGRIAVCAQANEEDGKHPVFIWSDDGGESWDYRILKSAPAHEAVWPHKGCRWQNRSAEPTAVQLSDGRLYMLARTSQDVYYEYYSEDDGNTWSDPMPSTLHGTLTSPQLLKLSDGRILCCFCNTQPLPEQDRTQHKPPLRPGEIDGTAGEDVFTNRDANHAAISEDDGKTWIGLREMALNTIRNNMDYRTVGLANDSLDKSVHQFQMLELPMNKVLVSYGQSDVSRKAIIFDVDWLYQKSREENFRLGAENVSTQVYLKSVWGNFRMAGHCSWNRTNGAVLMPDPEENFEEALFLSRTNDPRLFSDTQGVVWNFPAAHKGTVTVRLRVDGAPIHVSLTDRWFNPIDETVPYYSETSFALAREQLPSNQYSDLTISWDSETAVVSVNGETICSLPLKGETAHGLSYLCLQSAYDGVDADGCYIKSFSMKAD